MASGRTPDRAEVADLVGQHALDLVDLVGDRLAVHVNEDQVADDELVEVVEEGGVGETGAAGEDGVGARTFDREAGAVQMTDSFGQDAGVTALGIVIVKGTC